MKHSLFAAALLALALTACGQKEEAAATPVAPAVAEPAPAPAAAGSAQPAAGAAPAANTPDAALKMK